MGLSATPSDRAPSGALGWLQTPAPRVGGVAAWLARRLGAHVLVVRVAWAVVAMAAGIGVLVYGVAWWALRHTSDVDDGRPVTTRHDVGVTLAAASALALIGTAVPGLPMPLLWLTALVVLGVAISSASDDGVGPERALRGAPARAAIGAVLIVGAVLTLTARTRDLSGLVQPVIAAVALVAGLAVVVAPWIQRLTTTAETERLERIRAEERADIAAHLHDSVLQSLTLIQNRAGDPQVVAALAHQQERELRRWLYGSELDPDGAETLRSTLECLATEVEDQYLVAVETIVVGDHPAGPEVKVLAAAAREALVNAAKFSGSKLVTVFAEAETGRLSVFVRDRGEGFDLATIPGDRRGIADSIVARMQRAGGSATVRTTPGSGTEVALTIAAEG